VPKDQLPSWPGGQDRFRTLTAEEVKQKKATADSGRQLEIFWPRRGGQANGWKAYLKWRVQQELRRDLGCESPADSAFLFYAQHPGLDCTSFAMFGTL